jgi:hypothetical protein
MYRSWSPAALDLSFLSNPKSLNAKDLAGLKDISRTLTLEPVGTTGEIIVATQLGSKLHFSATSGRFLATTDGNDRVEYDGYRPVQGVLWPHRLLMTSKEHRMDLELSKIELDRQLDDSMFERPH